MIWPGNSKHPPERLYISSLCRLMEFAKKGLRFGWLSGSVLKRRDADEQRESPFSLALSTPPFLCDSKKEPANSSAPERCSSRFLLQIQRHRYLGWWSAPSSQRFTTILLIIACLASSIATAQSSPTVQPSLILVTGAAGTEEYGQHFSAAADQWRQLARARQWQLVNIDGTEESGGASQREQFQTAIQQGSTDASTQLWIVFIGHGTAERGSDKLNLVGADVSAKDLTLWLAPLNKPLIFIACASSSAPFLPQLSGPKRVIVTATKSGSENNYSRFGEQLAVSLLDPATDIDHDDEISLLEAFLAASAKTDKFYREQSRLTTEHALLDDNGDKMGTGAEFFKGARAVKSAQGGKQPDGAIASRIVLSVLPDAPKFTDEELKARAQIEEQLDTLRATRPNPPTDEYWNQLEQLLIKLAQLYKQAKP